MMSLDQTPINQLITGNIDTWTSTVKTKATTGRGSSKKLELYGVKKLRELILELAIRGKLVPQDLTDEPASYFFPDMEEEKSALVKANKLKKQKATPQIDGASVPYELPAQWVWMGLPDVTFFQEGPGILAKDFRDAGVPLIRISGMHGEKVSLEGCNFLDESMVLKKWEHFKLDLGDIVLSSSASLGKVAKVSEETVGAIVYTGLIRFKTYAALSENYMSRFFESMEFARQINSSKTGAAIKHFGPTHLKKMVIPVPPLKEQHRIVEKVDELMTLCDQLDQQTEASIAAHQVLVTTLLDTLTNSANAEELMQNWQMVAENFDTLFITEESIDQLKQTILQLAVMGKLVPQDPSDEPAAKLLERIAEEKAQLIKNKKIKKQKELPPIADDEKPFELPNGWEWCRFGNVAISRLGKMLDKSKNVGIPLPYLRNTNVQWHRFELDDIKLMKIEEAEKEELLVLPGDLLICEGGEPGRCAIWKDKKQEIYFQKALHRARPLGQCLSEYLQICLTVDASNGNLNDYFTGATIKHFVGAKLNNYVHSLPPIKEQSRIVAKAAELISICNLLKIHLKESQTTQLHLTDAIVEQTAN